MPKFPGDEWLSALDFKLNNDDRYAQVARNWEGDMVVVIEPEGAVTGSATYYLDLWHGRCRQAIKIEDKNVGKASLTLRAPYHTYVRLLKGELDPMQALLTRQIHVQGNMAKIMTNVPTVLDFVRCCREISDEFE